ncbi:MAG: hypothetical protein ACQER6_09885 [Pseudomonadota bacterium]
MASQKLDRTHQRLDIGLTRGDPLTITVPVTNKSDGTPADLSGKTPVAGIRLDDGSTLPMEASVDGSAIVVRLSRSVSAQLGPMQLWGLELLEDADPEYGGLTILGGLLTTGENVPNG